MPIGSSVRGDVHAGRCRRSRISSCSSSKLDNRQEQSHHARPRANAPSGSQNSNTPEPCRGRHRRPIPYFARRRHTRHLVHTINDRIRAERHAARSHPGRLRRQRHHSDPGRTRGDPPIRGCISGGVQGVQWRHRPRFLDRLFGPGVVAWSNVYRCGRPREHDAPFVARESLPLTTRLGAPIGRYGVAA